MSKEKIKYLFYTIAHPLDGFYEIRHRGRGNVGLALLTVLFCSLAYTLNRRYASFIVNPVNTREVDSLQNIGSMIVLFFLFCIGNWSVTSLLNGEGRMRDIITTTGYALLPIPLLFIPATLFSQFVAADEQIFYQIIMDFAVIWGVLLVICSNMVIHNFSLAKELEILILTAAAMVVILFIMLLFYSMFQQIMEFFRSIYTELIYRV